MQQRIAEDPGLLGLGDLVLKDKERAQPRAGRLDLLLQDPETGNRYEVEIQLGATDEAHIIRTIEYWDVERKRYSQYDHTAVIVAEDITSRFLNVISLFNGFIPLVAIQMRTLKVGDTISLVFTKVLDQVNLGLVDQDEEVEAIADRAYWEERSSKDSVAMADEVLQIIHKFDPDLVLKSLTEEALEQLQKAILTFSRSRNVLSTDVFYRAQDTMEGTIQICVGERLLEAGTDYENTFAYPGSAGGGPIRAATGWEVRPQDLLKLQALAFDSEGLRTLAVHGPWARLWTNSTCQPSSILTHSNMVGAAQEIAEGQR